MAPRDSQSGRRGGAEALGVSTAALQVRDDCCCHAAAVERLLAHFSAQNMSAEKIKERVNSIWGGGGVKAPSLAKRVPQREWVWPGTLPEVVRHLVWALSNYFLFYLFFRLPIQAFLLSFGKDLAVSSRLH